jgi:hypothetical protein
LYHIFQAGEQARRFSIFAGRGDKQFLFYQIAVTKK